ncbi:MAG TPA: transglutaminase family protein [Candidatus Binatia bacterium]|nr:transglutaminase family protein [Candidatus Binatia bacterium]
MSATSFRCYRVEHRTTYRYSEPVTLSHQQLHLTARPLIYQQSQAHDVIIVPAPTYRRERTDAFGNPVTEIAIESAHSTLDIIARSVVEVGARELPAADKTAPWETVREALAYRAGWRPAPSVFEATQFLFESPHVRVKRELRAYASDCFTSDRPVLQGAQALMGKIYADFKFDADATTTTTPVMTFFRQKRGVCQDFSHFMISCLRSNGLAARYVSGYLATRSAPGKQRPVGTEASHAWVSLFIPGTGWIDLDPTNNLLPSCKHITLGWGRDFSDVTPLRGVINGGGEQSLTVKVTVEEMIERVGVLEQWNSGKLE